MPRMPKSETLPNRVCTVVLIALVLPWSIMLAAAQGQQSASSRISWRTGQDREKLAAAQGQQSASSRISWRTGQDREKQLDTAPNIQWSSNPLRRALANLSSSQQVAIFLDRRVDPGQLITFSAQMVSMRQILDDLAGRLRQGVCHVGPVVYIGPKETAAVLATVAEQRDEETQSLPAAVRSRLRRAVPVNWPELTTPRELIAEQATSVGMKVNGIEQLPHDLWPAVDLPPLTFAQRMSLLLAGFSRTFSYGQDGLTIQIVALPETAVVKRTYRPRIALGNTVAMLTRHYPNATISASAGKVTVTGTVEDHDAIKRALEGRADRSPSNGRQAVGQTVYNGKIEATVGAIAAKLAKDLELEVEFDPRTTEKLNSVVSYEAKNASLTVLLDAVFSQAGLSYELTGKSLRVLPGEVE